MNVKKINSRFHLNGGKFDQSLSSRRLLPAALKTTSIVRLVKISCFGDMAGRNGKEKKRKMGALRFGVKFESSQGNVCRFSEWRAASLVFFGGIKILLAARPSDFKIPIGRDEGSRSGGSREDPLWKTGCGA